MIPLTGAVKIYYCRTPINLHRSFDGLPGAVEEYLKKDPRSGHLFVFFNRTCRMVKILYWDGDGYAIWSKRLVQGMFNIPRSADGKIDLEARELQAILSGIKPKRYYKRFALKKVEKIFSGLFKTPGCVILPGIMDTENITTLEQAKQLIAILQDRNTNLSNQIALLLDQIALLMDRNRDLEQKNQKMQQRLDWFLRQFFGQKSEKILPGPEDESYLPGFEGSQPEKSEEKTMETVREHERKKREVNGWSVIPPDFSA